jgi:hypothetical protein
MVWSFSLAVEGKFNHGWPRRKAAKAEQTQEKYPTSNCRRTNTLQRGPVCSRNAGYGAAGAKPAKLA